VPLHGKKGLDKKTKRGDGVTKFWYTLKNLHPSKKNCLINGAYLFPMFNYQNQHYKTLIVSSEMF